MKLIIFDCDGTLVDSQHLIVEAMGLAFVECGLPLPARDLILRQIGLSIDRVMMALSESLDPDRIAALVSAYRNAFGQLRRDPHKAEPLYPGAGDALRTLHEREDVLLGIATGKSLRGVRALLEREGFAEYFTTIQTADTAPSKPHPAMILQAMEETGIGPEATVMVGDTGHDMAMAKSALVTPIGVSWGYHGIDELTDAGAELIVNGFPELMSHLNGTETLARVAL
jgi:phosphoglycolate phosphatase